MNTQRDGWTRYTFKRGSELTFLYQDTGVFVVQDGELNPVTLLMPVTVVEPLRSLVPMELVREQWTDHANGDWTLEWWMREVKQ